MDIRKRLIAPFAQVSTTDETLTVDLSSFVLRLLLFEKYICASIRLREIPFLIEAFGYEAIRALLSSKAIDIHCDLVGMAQVGQAKVLESREKKGILPLGSFSFSTFRYADRTKFIHESLQPFHKIEGLKHKDIVRLKRDVVSRILPISTQADDDTLQQFKSDLRSNVPSIKSAVIQAFKHKVGVDIIPSDLSIHIHQIDDDDFRAESNLVKDFKLTDKEAHEVVQGGLLTVNRLNRPVAEMKAYSALSGFQEAELPMFDEKLSFILRTISPKAQEERLQRVFAIKGFRDLDDLISRGQVDLEKLLEVRETKECREFRDWLWSIDSVTDAEIEERINSLREKLSWFTHGTGGKSVRWLASTGIGLIPGVGAIVSGATGLLDTFLLEKILPAPGAISFLNSMYPSIFREDPRITPANYLKIK